MTDQQPRTGARQRRRGLYGPPPRLTRTSPLTGRLVWHIGDWGRASEHIGARWEHVAGALARQRLGPRDYLIVLLATPALMVEVLSSGLPHAAALRAWSEDGQEAIERYYRLGAGVDGALTRLHTGLFETEPTRIDAVALIGELRQAGNARTLNALLLYLQHELANRKRLEDRLMLLPRSNYAFGR